MAAADRRTASSWFVAADVQDGWNLNGWLYMLVELCSWNIEKGELTDRSDRPSDNPDRRRPHADR